MNIYGNDGNLIFGENNYEIIESYNDSIKIKTSKNGVYIVKLSFCDGSDVKVLPNEIYCEKADEDNTVTVGGRVYHYVTINGFDWITENLDLDTANSERRTGYPEFGSYYTYNDITEIESNLSNGWHVPTEEDWLTSMPATTDAAQAAKYQAKGYTGFPNATNETGFSAVPSTSSISSSFISFRGLMNKQPSSGTHVYAIESAKTFTYNYGSGKMSVRICRTHV